MGKQLKQIYSESRGVKKVQIIHIHPAEKNIDYKGGFFPGKLKHCSNTENIFFLKSEENYIFIYS